MSDGNWKPNKRQWPWRDFLTADEEKVIAKCDVAKAKFDAAKQRYKAATKERWFIVNRALQRAKYAAKP